MTKAIRVQTPDGSVEDGDGRLLFCSLERFRRDIVEGDCCFLCGTSPNEAPFTDEHVIPDWVLREFSLHDLKVTLANGKMLSYSRYRVPCCSKCNSLLGREVEKPISQLLKSGYNGVVDFIRKESSWKLFAWMNLIFLKTHLKDSALQFSLDSRKGTEKISDFYDWSPMHHIHCIVRTYFTGASINSRLMGSMYVMPAKIRPHLGKFDYADLSIHRTMLIQLGEVAIVSVLDDAGWTNSMLKDWLLPKLGGSLSSIQLREILARFAQANADITTRPQFHTTFEKGQPVMSVIHPEKFEFGNGGPAELGKLMDHVCTPLLNGYGGNNLDEITAGIRSGCWTFLVNSAGARKWGQPENGVKPENGVRLCSLWLW